MKDIQSIGLKKKVIIATALVLVAAILITTVVLYASIPMKVDWDSLYDIGSEVALLAPKSEGNPYDAPALIKTKNPDSDWKVLQFTDMHLSHANSGKNNKNTITLNKYIETIMREKPDFVVLTGDIITSTGGRARAIQFAEIMEELGVYWAYNLGNHEGDQFFKLTRKELMKIIEKYPHCLSEGSVKKTKDHEKVWGIGNFVVNLLGGDHEVVQSMIFLDSGDAITNQDAKKYGVEKGSYDYLKDNQIKWYGEQIEQVTAGFTKEVKTMLFIHIPLIEQHNLEYIGLIDPKSGEQAGDAKDGWTEKTPKDGYTYVGGVEARDHEGKLVGKVALRNGWNVLAGTANYEKVSSSKYNSGMYDKMKELRAYVNGLFCGHDHVNNSIIFENYKEGETPLYLCYGYCSGFDTYNLYKSKKTDNPNRLMKGYSIITVHQTGTFDYSGVSFDADDYLQEYKYIVNSLPFAAVIHA